MPHRQYYCYQEREPFCLIWTSALTTHQFTELGHNWKIGQLVAFDSPSMARPTCFHRPHSTAPTNAWKTTYWFLPVYFEQFQSWICEWVSMSSTSIKTPKSCNAFKDLPRKRIFALFWFFFALFFDLLANFSTDSILQSLTQERAGTRGCWSHIFEINFQNG